MSDYAPDKFMAITAAQWESSRKVQHTYPLMRKLQTEVVAQAKRAADAEAALAALAPPPGPATPPQLGKGVDPNYFMTLAAMRRTTDDWIVLSFREGGEIRVPIHPDNVAVLVEPERH